MYLIHEPSPWASDKEWREFLARMMKLPQNDRFVQAAVELAQDELGIRSGKITREEVMARRQARMDEAIKYLREHPAELRKTKQDKK